MLKSFLYVINFLFKSNFLTIHGFKFANSIKTKTTFINKLYYILSTLMRKGNMMLPENRQSKKIIENENKFLKINIKHMYTENDKIERIIFSIFCQRFRRTINKFFKYFQMMCFPFKYRM